MQKIPHAAGQQRVSATATNDHTLELVLYVQQQKPPQ